MGCQGTQTGTETTQETRACLFATRTSRETDTAGEQRISSTAYHPSSCQYLFGSNKGTINPWAGPNYIQVLQYSCFYVFFYGTHYDTSRLFAGGSGGACERNIGLLNVGPRPAGHVRGLGVHQRTGKEDRKQWHSLTVSKSVERAELQRKLLTLIIQVLTTRLLMGTGTRI